MNNKGILTHTGKTWGETGNSVYSVLRKIAFGKFFYNHYLFSIGDYYETKLPVELRRCLAFTIVFGKKVLDGNCVLQEAL